MKHASILIMVIGIIAGLYSPAISHTVHYHVENKGISVRVFYAEDDPDADILSISTNMTFEVK